MTIELGVIGNAQIRALPITPNGTVCNDVSRRMPTSQFPVQFRANE